MLKLDRRVFLAASVAGALVPALAPNLALAQEVNAADLLVPGPLGDKALGPATAKVSVVEYASMSCPHCAHFDSTTFDDFKLKYVDGGKVRYVFREFPLNAPALAVAMLARCAPADQFFDIVHTYFRTQEKWLVGSNVKAAILDVGQQFGFTEQSFDACLKNQALFEAINAVQERGSGFGVKATPTFFINGKKYEGALSLEDLDKAIEPLLN
jgi:protein-disulfide isomerase